MVVVSSANLETSISRVKYQLSGEKGHGFNICGNVPLDVIKKQPTKHLIKKKKNRIPSQQATFQMWKLGQ